MKKNYLKIALVLFFAMAAGYNIYTFTQKTELSDVMLANIEALATDENNQPDWDYPDGIESGRFECGAKLANGKRCTFQVITCSGGGRGCNSRPCNLHG